MGIQINGTTDVISSTDGSLSVVGQQLINTDNINATGIISATAFRGPNVARGGGSDLVFYENDINVTTDYTITSNRNAMTAGPIGINTGITVTIPSGSTWTIV